MKPILISSGEPAGIGPDICLSLADLNLPVVIAGDPSVLRERAKKLNQSIEFTTYKPGQPLASKGLNILPIEAVVPAIPGQLDSRNAAYVINLLTQSINACINNEFSALVTAPVHKGIINEADIPFTGHTELLAQQCGVDNVVMLLACETLRVALVTTHLPIKDVASHISLKAIVDLVRILNQYLKSYFAIKKPVIYIAGLNPHAGEGGYIGKEEIEVIQPAINQLTQENILVKGPLSADTLFSKQNCHDADVFVCMYHDQGLPVLKYAGFGQSVNITLGLPIIRTSVDHGTALDIAGSGKADAGSLHMAIQYALQIAANRDTSCNKSV